MDLVDGPPAKRTRSALRALAAATPKEANAAGPVPPAIRDARQSQTEQFAVPDEQVEVPEVPSAIKIPRTRIVVKNCISKVALMKDIQRRLAEWRAEVASTGSPSQGAGEGIEHSGNRLITVHVVARDPVRGRGK